MYICIYVYTYIYKISHKLRDNLSFNYVTVNCQVKMARVRGTLNRYKESDYIFVTVERFGEKKKESEEKLYSHKHFESSQIILVFVSFFCLVTSLPFFDGSGGKSILMSYMKKKRPLSNHRNSTHHNLLISVF